VTTASSVNQEVKALVERIVDALNGVIDEVGKTVNKTELIDAWYEVLLKFDAEYHCINWLSLFNFNGDVTLRLRHGFDGVLIYRARFKQWISQSKNRKGFDSSNCTRRTPEEAQAELESMRVPLVGEAPRKPTDFSPFSRTKTPRPTGQIPVEKEGDVEKGKQELKKILEKKQELGEW